MNFSIDSCLLWNHFLSSAFVIVACKCQNQTFPFSYSINFIQCPLYSSFELLEFLEKFFRVRISRVGTARAAELSHATAHSVLRRSSTTFYEQFKHCRQLCFVCSEEWSSCLALVLEFEFVEMEYQTPLCNCVKPSSPVSKKKKK